MTQETISAMAGRLAYQKDCEITPTYHDGEDRISWVHLSEPAQRTWIKNPTPRRCTIANHALYNDEIQGK